MSAPARTLPRYPIYVPSKGRAQTAQTAKFLTADGIPFRLVVEEPEADEYRARWPAAEVLVLPFQDQGTVVPARNWIADHAAATGADRHWQLDDNIWGIRRLWRGRRLKCHAGTGLRVCEDFTDRYENIAVAGLNYLMFVQDSTERPFYVNVHVYSCCLIDHRLPFRWRGRYNEDTDLCLQALSAGYCTVALNVFMAHKQRTMTKAGGNTAELYGGDGRAHMARALERRWPYVVETRRRFSRPQHVIRDGWRGFDTPLIRRTGHRLGRPPRGGRVRAGAGPDGAVHERADGDHLPGLARHRVASVDQWRPCSPRVSSWSIVPRGTLTRTGTIPPPSRPLPSARTWPAQAIRTGSRSWTKASADSSRVPGSRRRRGPGGPQSGRLRSGTGASAR